MLFVVLVDGTIVPSEFVVMSDDPLPPFTGPKEGWTHQPNGPRMHSGTLPNSEHQSFYFSEDHPSMPGWFKGMEIIIRERGLWPEGVSDLLSQCPGFHCLPGHTDCCCWRILFIQPNFISQKSQLQELVESRGHLCDLYNASLTSLSFTFNGEFCFLPFLILTYFDIL